MTRKRRDLPPNFMGQEWGGLEAPHPIMFAPARSILPFLRYPLGYSMVHPLYMFRLAAFMIAVPPVTWALYGVLLNGSGRRIPADTGHIYLIGFAVLSFIASLITFLLRWTGPRRGERIHQRDAGYSWLAWHTQLPIAVTEMLIVPLGIGGAGWIIDDTISINLGRWLILSACSLFGMAMWESRRRWSQQRASIDEERRAEAYQSGFLDQKYTPVQGTEPDEAELGKVLGRAGRPASGPNQQRGDIGPAGRRRDPPAQDRDDTTF